LKAWFTTPLAPYALNKDLQLLQLLVKYESENAGIFHVALKKLVGHLWYLSEELIDLAFFDDTISVQKK
jgi:hypothetical protein